MNKLIYIFIILLLILGIATCQKKELQSSSILTSESNLGTLLSESHAASFLLPAKTQSITSKYLDEINDELMAQGINYRVFMAETITASVGKEVGKAVFAKIANNKDPQVNFVPSDKRREWSGSNANEITFAIDQSDAIPPLGDLNAEETTEAILRGNISWGKAICSDIDFVQNKNLGYDIGFAASQTGLGGSPLVFADIQHAGWTDIDFEGAILGVTFTFVFIDNDGSITDIDDNKKSDVAFREIYYDPSWNWSTDGTNIDVESIVLHETGHGLGQSQIGKIMVKENNELEARPRAVMNPIYIDPIRELTGADIAAHCEIWSSWPNI